MTSLIIIGLKMKKELLLAIFMGLALGLVIVFGFYRTRIMLTPKNQTTNAEVSPTPEASSDLMSNLVIHSPLDESIQESADVTIAGTTNENEFIVILVGDQDFVTTADDSGNFSISAKLEAGSNVIQIKSINEDGKVLTKELTVIYTTKPLLGDNSEASPSAETKDE